MSDDVERLLARSAAEPAAPVDPDEVRAASRRRTQRQRSVGAGAGLAVAAAVAVAVPLLVSDPAPVIDDVAGQDDDAGPTDDEVVDLDLPDGWTQVRVGDAVFGIPDRVEVRELTADDPGPCPNTDRVSTAHVAPDGWADGGGCDEPGPGVASLIATTTGRTGPTDDASVDEVTVGGVPATRITRDHDLDWGPDRTYVVDALDLRLTFTALAYDPQLEADVLATVTPASGPIAGGVLPDGVPIEVHDGPEVEDSDPVEDGPADPGDDGPADADADADQDPPPEPVTFTVGDLAFRVPGEFEFTTGGDQLPCHTGAQIAVLDALTPQPGPECPAASPGGTLVALVVDDRVAPAFRPGEGDADGSAPVDEVELLGTPGTREVWTDDAGFEAQSWWFPDLDLHLEVRGAELTPGLVDTVLSGASRR